jgi:two-component system cell cycle sensor histidine kinase/response regulator CckA
MTLVSGVSVQDRPIHEVRPLAGTASEEVWCTRSGLLVQGEKQEEIQEIVDRYPRLLPSFQSGLRSMISVPLISRDEVIGVLHIRTNEPNAYSERDLKLAERVGIQIAGAIANAHLFKERIRAEKEMANLQEQLRQSQKMEAVGRLAGGIAHDFNNFLTVMRGRSQLALMELKEGDPLRESFEAIENATTKSANLVRQLLAFSRRQVMQMIILDLNTLIRDLEKMLRRLIGEDIELLTVLTEDLGKVKADPGQIEQVLLNLAVNARDAMAQGGKLTIETANVDLDEAYARNHAGTKAGPYVMFSVTDTGVGMAPEVKKQIFEPFFTTKEKGKGTGLGLATVYGIVKQSGGNIWVYSEPGQGATFKIYLPRVEEVLTEEKEKEAPGLFRGVEVILVVEDEEEVRKVVLEVLKNQGYNVWEAGNGEEAMLICQQYKDTIHLLVSDVVLPGVNGPALARQLVALHPEMKLLYMSGYTENAIVHHGVLDKGVNYIQKPFTMEGLVKKVREVLDKDTKPVT